MGARFRSKSTRRSRVIARRRGAPWQPAWACRAGRDRPAGSRAASTCATLIARGGHAPRWRSGGTGADRASSAPSELPDGSVQLLRIGAEAGGIVLQVTGRGRARDRGTGAAGRAGPARARPRRPRHFTGSVGAPTIPAATARPACCGAPRPSRTSSGSWSACDPERSPAVAPAARLVGRRVGQPAVPGRSGAGTPSRLAGHWLLARSPLARGSSRQVATGRLSRVAAAARSRGAHPGPATCARGARDPRELDDLTARASRCEPSVRGVEARSTPAGAGDDGCCASRGPTPSA